MSKLKILTKAQVEKELKNLPGWTLENGKIRKEFKFTNFIKALSFINQIAFYFEKLNHHADIHIYYGKVVFELQRYDVGGKITNYDILEARAIEDLYNQNCW